MVQVPNCRVASSDASRRTLKRRTQGLDRVRTVSSGGDTAAQLREEVKALSKSEREELLKQNLPIEIPVSHSLAI